MPITIRSQLKPGDVGKIIQLHGVVYSEEYGLDETFEAYVAEGLSKFILSLEEKRQKIWIIESEGEVVGCVAIVRNSEEECQLRWLILHPKLRGKGYGKSLVAEAISFSRKMGYKSIILWTFNELEVAIKIYKGFGFVKVEEKAHYIWGRNLVEEKYELLL